MKVVIEGSLYQLANYLDEYCCLRDARVMSHPVRARICLGIGLIGTTACSNTLESEVFDLFTFGPTPEFSQEFLQNRAFLLPTFETKRSKSKLDLKQAYLPAAGTLADVEALVRQASGHLKPILDHLWDGAVIETFDEDGGMQIRKRSGEVVVFNIRDVCRAEFAFGGAGLRN